MDKKFRTSKLSSASSFSDDKLHCIYKSVVNKTIKLQRRDFVEIDIVVSGKAIGCINGDNYELSAGAVIFLSPDDYHSYVIEDGNEIELIRIVFSIDMLTTEVTTVISSDVKVVNLDTVNYGCVVNVCKFLIEKYDDYSPAYDAIIKASIQWLFAFLSFIIKQHRGETNEISDFSKALLYINENFSQDDLNRDAVAAVMYMSPAHFSKKFHKAVGISFQDYLLNTRLNYAYDLIKTTNLTVSHIAHLSGFGSDSYFSKVFKKRFGVTPGQARKDKSDI